MIPNDTIGGSVQRRPFTMDRRRANHRGWRDKWGWEMGNAGPSMTQIATVCLAEKWHREGGAGFRPLVCGTWQSGWELKVGTRGRYIDRGRGRQEMKFGVRRGGMARV